MQGGPCSGKKCATVLKFHYRITRYVLADVTKRCINPRTSVQRFNESEEKGVLNWDTRRGWKSDADG